jgi:hypothetical protein
MRPVLARMITYSDLKCGRVSLADIALMNDALTVKAENEYRLREAHKKT